MDLGAGEKVRVERRAGTVVMLPAGLGFQRGNHKKAGFGESVASPFNKNSIGYATISIIAK